MKTSWLAAWLLLLAACGASAPARAPSYASEGSAGGYAPAAMPDYEIASTSSDDYAAEVPRARYAQAAPTPPAAPNQQVPTSTPVPNPNPSQNANRTASDGRAGPLLLYEAYLTLAVYEVEEKQTAILTQIRELGGYVQTQNANTLVVRVPAEKFDESVALAEAAGDVLARNIQAIDVGDQFRDLTIRIENAEAIRDRLEQLLARAQTVEEALAVEQQLERVTLTLEQLKGQLRALSDRIAFSTITITFQPQSSETISQPDIATLPFSWLEQLGLRGLLNLR